jgi:hypothetical protein
MAKTVYVLLIAKRVEHVMAPEGDYNVIGTEYSRGKCRTRCRSVVY